MTVVSGHQPAYLPWLGLLHKASLCDVFVYMDDVQFLDRDFNHRNRVLSPNGQILWLTVPVARKASPSNILKDILIQKEHSAQSWQQRHWATLRSCYGKCEYFKEYAPFFEWLYLENTWEYLVELNLAILRKALDWFDIQVYIAIASELDFSGTNSDLVLEHCRRFDAKTVVTGTHGRDYIVRDDFESLGVKVIFQDYQHPEYSQRARIDFVPCLSFVDLLFNHGPYSGAIMREGNVMKAEIGGRSSDVGPSTSILNR
jgi:hypothetical protein